MRRLLILLTVLSLLLLLMPVYGIANAKSPKPQDQVKNFMTAAAGLKVSKAAGYWVDGERSNVTSQLAKIPSGTKISVSGLKLAVANQTADTAEVTATYTLKTQLKGQKKAKQSNFSDTFNLKLVGNTWLISGTTMWEHLAGIATPYTPTATPTVTATPTPSPTTSGNPVRIGAVGPWSGPLGMAGVLYDAVMNLIEDQVKNQGGILGGRDVKFYRGDDRGVLAESVAQTKKLILEDKVTFLTWGGISAAQFNAVSDVAEEYKVPYIGLGLMSGLPAKKYTACLISFEYGIVEMVNFVTNYVKPKTIALLSYDASDIHDQLDGKEGVKGIKERLKEAGIDMVYEQYFPSNSTDLSPYLTKIKYLNPDLAFIYLNDVGQAILINKQITELGGWGNIKYCSGTDPATNAAAVKIPSAVGTYSFMRFISGSDEPGMKAFQDAFLKKYGKLPDNNHAFGYNVFWTAIKAIEMAGTDDPEKVAQALRSGKLEWDSAWGPLTIDSKGAGTFPANVVQIQQGGKLVKVWSSE